MSYILTLFVDGGGALIGQLLIYSKVVLVSFHSNVYVKIGHAIIFGILVLKMGRSLQMYCIC